MLGDRQGFEREFRMVSFKFTFYLSTAQNLMGFYHPGPLLKYFNINFQFYYQI